MIKKLFLGFLVLGQTIVFAAPPQVVVSIKPIHALVESLMEGVGEPLLLLPPNESPHHFNLLPSQAEDMSKADLFIWVGPELEKVLEKPIESLVKKGHTFTLLELTDINLMEYPNNSIDPHIWLDPENAKVIVSHITDKLIQLDPENKAQYGENRDILINDLDAMKETISKDLEEIRKEFFFVYHDAYRYFEDAFQLEKSIPLVTDEGGTIKASRRLELEKLAKEKKIKCIFTEPQHGTRTALALAKQMNLKLGELDPLGVNDPDEEENEYIYMMFKIASALKECLKGQGDGQS